MGLKWHSCNTSFGFKTSTWWVLIRKKRQPGLIGRLSLIFYLVGLLSELEAGCVSNCKREASKKGFGLEICGGSKRIKIFEFEQKATKEHNHI